MGSVLGTISGWGGGRTPVGRVPVALTNVCACLHIYGHTDMSGGWHALLAQCPRLIVGFSYDGVGRAGVTAEALTD